jgi:hypothetical protein
MIKTLRITSIIAAITGVGLFVFLGLYGFRGDPEIEQFLKSPSIIEEFRNSTGHRGLRDVEQSSPLIAQAGIFANIIAPPPPPPPAPVAKGSNNSLPPPPPAKAIFNVIATSYNQSRPEESLALIDETGKGLHWVRQGTEVARLKIEIKDGLILAKSGETTQEMRVIQQPTMSLMMGAAPLPATETPPVTPRTDKTRQPTMKTPTTSLETSAEQPMSPEQEKEMAQKIFVELEAAVTGGSEKTTVAEQPAPETASSDSTEAAADTGRITGTEAGKIGSLGKDLRAASPRDRAKLLQQKREERAKLLREKLEKAKQPPQQ